MVGPPPKGIVVFDEAPGPFVAGRSSPAHEDSKEINYRLIHAEVSSNAGGPGAPPHSWEQGMD